ncbi:MAG TPA: hypothetical protein VNF74_08095 [Terriglobales bacterium]|nr:hypothetical protein [Terriglobales bacterium]
MKESRKAILRCTRLAGVWLALLGLCAAARPPQKTVPPSARKPVAILVNPATPVSNLTLAQLREIMLGNRQFWPNHQPIVLLVRAPVAPERTAVLHIIYQMSEAEFRQYWIATIFRDEAATAPKIVYGVPMTNELVVAIPGAIAFLEADEVQPGPKVLTIDGKRPGEKGYPLQ